MWSIPRGRAAERLDDIGPAIPEPEGREIGDCLLGCIGDALGGPSGWQESRYQRPRRPSCRRQVGGFDHCHLGAPRWPRRAPPASRARLIRPRRLGGDPLSSARSRRFQPDIGRGESNRERVCCTPWAPALVCQRDLWPSAITIAKDSSTRKSFNLQSICLRPQRSASEPHR
jgi:hypothetical protein